MNWRGAATPLSPSAEKLRELLPKLGKLVSASAAIPNWRPQSYYDQPGRGTRSRDGGGVLLTQGIHTLDLFLSFVGEPQEVKSFVATTPVHKMETEDLVAAAVRFKNGAIGTVHATTTAYPGFAERIELIGTRGTALLEGTSLKLQIHDEQPFEFRTEAGRRDRRRPDGLPARLAPRRAGGLPGFDQQNREPRVSGAEALKVHRFIDRILQSGG